MRIPIILATTVLGISAAGAQTSSHCRARPLDRVQRPEIPPGLNHAGRLQLRAP